MLSLFFFLKLYRQALSDTERHFTIEIFELGTFWYFLAFTEQPDFAFSELFFKKEFAGQEKLANYNDVKETKVNPIYFTVFSHPLVQLQNLFPDFVR